MISGSDFFRASHQLLTSQVHNSRPRMMCHLRPYKYLSAAPCKPVDRTPEQHVREDCEQQCHQQCLRWVKPAKDLELVDGIKDKSDDENLAHRLPTTQQHLAALRWIGNQSKRLSLRTAVPDSIPNCEERRHEWLEDEPKMQWPVQPAQEVPNGCGKILHRLPQLGPLTASRPKVIVKSL